MPFVLIHPNSRTPLLDMNEVMREQHEEERKARARIREQRTKLQIPLDDKANPEVVEEKAMQVLTHAKAVNYEAMRKAATELWEMTSATLSDPGEFERLDSIVGVEVSFLALSESRRQILEAKRLSMSGLGIFDSAKQRADFKREFVKSAVAQVSLSGEVFDVDEKCLDILDASGILTLLYLAAERFQNMPEKKLLPFGR